MIKIILIALLSLTLANCADRTYKVKQEAKVEDGRILNKVPQWFVDAQVDKGLIKDRDADEYIYFFVRLTKTQLELFEPGRLDKINNNVYLIDFLKYILVRDPRLRPTIDNVLKRFEHILKTC